MLLQYLAALASIQTSWATQLYVASYGGTVTTLNHAPSTNDLYSSSISHDCAPTPSWLTLDPSEPILYCVDRGSNAKHGTFNVFETTSNGTLTKVGSTETLTSGVFALQYGPNGTGVVVPQLYVF